MAAPTNLHRDLGRIEGKLDAVIGEMRRDVRRAHSRLDEHEGRLDVIENREVARSGALRAARWLYGAFVAVIGYVSGALGGGAMFK